MIFDQACSSPYIGVNSLDQISGTRSHHRSSLPKQEVELATQARSLYLTRNHAERTQLLKWVPLNCDTDGVASGRSTDTRTI